jgi:cytochrome P450
MNKNQITTEKNRLTRADQVLQYPLPPGGDGGLFAKLQRIRPARRDALNYLMSVPRIYGDISHFQLGQNHSYIVVHPDHIREILVEQGDLFQRATTSSELMSRIAGNGLLSSTGDFWRQQRKLMQPAFHHKRIITYAQIMVDRTVRLLGEWSGGQTRNLEADMMALTLDIATDTLFGVEMGAAALQVGQAVEEAQRAIVGLSRLLVPVPDWLPIPYNFRVRHAAKTLDQILLQIIQDRRASGEDRGDLLSMLLLAQDEDGNRQMNDQQVRDEAMTIFIAGHETTANALTWTWCLLSEHPEVKARLWVEVDHVLGGKPPTVAQLAQLPYTEMVIKESMRLYPPAWIITREPLKDTVVGGYRFIKDSFVMISPYVTHRDPRFFDDPAAFKPERFEPARVKDLPRDAYLPFGDGAHVCIGKAFAMMEAKIVLATVAQHFDLKLAAGHKVEPEPLITLRPRYGMKMDVHERLLTPRSDS